MKSYKGLLLKHLSLDTSHRQCKYNTQEEEQWLAVPHNVVRGRGSFNIIKCTGFLRVHDNCTFDMLTKPPSEHEAYT